MSKANKIRLLNPRYFGDSPEGPVLMGSKCTRCGQAFFPRRTVCSSCFQKEVMTDVPLSKRGKINAYTVSSRSHIGLKTPFALGYIDLPENVRIFSLFTECEPFDQLKIGMEMEMITDKLMEDEFGYDVLVYKFRPVKREGV